MTKDFLKGGKSVRSKRSARLNMPRAAFGLKKYCCGTSPVSINPDNVDSWARLGDSEVPAVKHTPFQSIPEFGQRGENNSEISSAVRAEEARNVFKNENSGATFSNQASKFEKEGGLSSIDSRPWTHAGERDVLARESCRPNISERDVCTEEQSDILSLGYCGPVLLENRPAEVVDFALKDRPEPCLLEAEFKTPDARKERGKPERLLDGAISLQTSPPSMEHLLNIRSRSLLRTVSSFVSAFCPRSTHPLLMERFRDICACAAAFRSHQCNVQ